MKKVYSRLDHLTQVTVVLGLDFWKSESGFSWHLMLSTSWLVLPTFVLMHWSEIKEPEYVHLYTHITFILFLISGVIYYLKNYQVLWFSVVFIGWLFLYFLSCFFVCFYRGKYRIVYITPEFCSSNLDLLQQLQANIGKWYDRIFISIY